MQLALIKKGIKEVCSWRLLVSITIASLICAIPISIAKVTSWDEAQIYWNQLALTYTKVLIACFAGTCLTYGCLHVVCKFTSIRFKTLFTPTVLGIAIPAAVMFICWLPYFVAFAPGTMGWDTTFQISQCYPNHGPILSIPWAKTNSYVDCQFSDHHPVFTSLVFGFFALGSEWFTGSWNAGLTCYIILQSIAMSLSLSLVCCYIRRLGCPPILSALALVFSAHCRYSPLMLPRL